MREFIVPDPISLLLVHFSIQYLISKRKTELILRSMTQSTFVRKEQQAVREKHRRILKLADTLKSTTTLPGVYQEEKEIIIINPVQKCFYTCKV